MITDADIEALSVSSVTPQQAADNLVSAALTAGGADNVTVVVVDILNDGVADAGRRRAIRHFAVVLAAIVATFVVVGGCFYAFIRSEWYLGVNGDTVGIYQGVTGSFMQKNPADRFQTADELYRVLRDYLAGRIQAVNNATAMLPVQSTNVIEDARRSPNSTSTMVSCSNHSNGTRDWCLDGVRLRSHPKAGSKGASSKGLVKNVCLGDKLAPPGHMNLKVAVGRGGRLKLLAVFVLLVVDRVIKAKGIDGHKRKHGHADPCLRQASWQVRLPDRGQRWPRMQPGCLSWSFRTHRFLSRIRHKLR